MNKKHLFSNFGFSTILLGFSMMCIITFSALALLTANSDYKLSQKVAEKNTTYYEVEKEAYITLSEIDHHLRDIYADCNDADAYFQMALNMLATRGDGKTNIKGQDYLYHYSKKLSESQTLEITIQILYPTKKNDGFYKITQWQTITDTNIETDNTLHLIGDN